VAPETLELLKAYTWPGNVRELQSVLKQSLLRAAGRVLVPTFLPDVLQYGRPVTREPEPDLDSGLLAFVKERLAAGSESVYEETVAFVERILLPMVLDHTGGHQAQAAKVLGVTRRTLRNRLRDLKLTVARSVEAMDDEE
jgi:DNA-binding NtrC family response regulator